LKKSIAFYSGYAIIDLSNEREVIDMRIGERSLYEIEVDYNCGLIENEYADTAMSIEEVKELCKSDYVEGYLNLKRELVILLSNNRYFKVLNRRALGW